MVLEAFKERLTTSKLAQKHELSPQQISTWKREFIDNAERLFGGKNILLTMPAREQLTGNKGGSFMF